MFNTFIYILGMLVFLAMVLGSVVGAGAVVVMIWRELRQRWIEEKLRQTECTEKQDRAAQR